MRLFASAVPGLAGELAAELASFPTVAVQDTGFDGRSDIVTLTVDPPAARRLLSARLAEDVFVEIGRTLRSEGDRPGWIAGRLWRPARADRALAARAAMARPVRGKASLAKLAERNRCRFRVIARVLQERSFLRSDLRRELTVAVRRRHPQWRQADPADLEIWVIEYQPGKLLAGLRASGAGMRQHGGREVERGGALRPTVAAAMVRLAGAPGAPGAPGGRLLDPCCGSGTVLAEAVAAGWRAAGGDIDPEALRATRRNAPRAALSRADAGRLPYRDASVDAYVSNLPFGKRFTVDGMEEWLPAVLGEAARVTRAGGRVVVLAPSVPRGAVPPSLVPAGRVPIRLLGTRTVIWAYRRGSP